MSIKLHGTRSTITSFDQSLPNLKPEQRAECARLMVRHLYADLADNVRRHVEQRISMLPPDASPRELIAGRDWLFEGSNYHIDVSHLNSVVRFARSIDAPAKELDLALQLAEYGTKLDPQLRYPGDPPFDDFYPAHVQFFRVLLDRNRDEALRYFQEKLDQRAGRAGQADPGLRAGRSPDPAAGRRPKRSTWRPATSTRVGDDARFSFADLCREAGRLDVLQSVAREQNDAVTFLGALLSEKK